MKKLNLLTTLTLTFFAMFIGMLIYEGLKEYLHPDITEWESHVYTIIFSSLLATVGAYFVVSRRELLTNRIMKETANRRHVEDVLKESEEKLRLLAAAAHDAIIMMDHEGNIFFWNDAAEKMFGHTNQEAIGKNCHRLIVPARYHEAYDRGFGIFRHSGQGAAIGNTLELEARKEDGTEFPVELSLSGMRFHGEWSAVGIIRDITKRNQMEKTLQMHSVIMANLSEGVYLIRACDGVIIYTNPRFEKMLGYGPGELIGKNVSVVNAPTERSPEETAKEIIESLNKNKVWSGEIKNIRNDGSLLWCYASVTTFDHPDYGPVWVSVHTDITERKQAEEALKESEAKYYDLYDSAPDMYYSLDSSGIIRECNKAFLRKTGYSKEQLLGRPIVDLCDPDSKEEAKKTFQQFQAMGEVSDVERRVKCQDGRIISVSLNASAVRDKDGNITHTRSIWRDITERKEHEEMIRALSITDQLTGLYNRRGFTALAEQQMRVAEREKKGMLLLFADVDDLKQINDTLGHKSGDEAIVEASNVLKEVFRKMDIIARMGGDEFAVLAPEASLEYSDVIQNRLKEQLDIHNARVGRDYNLSLSIGLVYHDPSTPSSLDELISRADTLMYEQKRGKNPSEAS